MSWFDGFVTRRFEVNGVNIHARVPAAKRAGKPALLLLHGFPQSHVMWHRVARLLGGDPGVRIIPFRGEYYYLTDRLANQVKGLVYPVPDPRYPFLGVHLTRDVHR